MPIVANLIRSIQRHGIPCFYSNGMIICREWVKFGNIEIQETVKVKPDLQSVRNYLGY